MRILTFTTLYPNAAAPSHGVFVENRLRDFIAKTQAELRVIAPIPWFPSGAAAFGKYSAFARAPESEARHGISIQHPRYILPPKIGMTFAAFSLKRCFEKAARNAIATHGDIDLIDAHYLYPDGVAAVAVAQQLDKPVVLTARGSDVSQLTDFPRQRRLILDAINKADAVVCVAKALKDRLIELGAPAEKLHVLRNGVDLEAFKPKDRDAARARFNVTGDVVACVGHLIERKGCDIVIDALAGRSNTTLILAGDGPERTALERRAQSNNVDICFLGTVPHADLPDVYAAADCLALASSREGWPNVLLEAMACGAAAAAAPVWGCKEIVTEPAAGVLAADRSPSAMGAAIDSVLMAAKNPNARTATRRYAERFSWRETSEGLDALFSDILLRKSAARGWRQRPLPARPKGARAKLLVTVDTEEEFNWSSFDANAYTVSDPRHIDRFQTLCAEADARPLYFLTYPLLKDDRTAAYFKSLKATRAADCGLHLHQWTTPPLGGFADVYYSWQGNLPTDIYEEKLKNLADAFADVFGDEATAHRAGRYGVTPAAYGPLARIGITHDFSPSPAFDFSKDGGPNFHQMSNRAFVLETLNAGSVITVPATGARAVRGGSHFLRGGGVAPGFTQSPHASLLRTAFQPPSITAPMRLSSEGARFDDLQALAKHLAGGDAPILTLSLHSTTLTPGVTPYGANEAAVDEFLETTRRFLQFFASELGDIVDLEDVQRLTPPPKTSE
ncbi:MAG: glycosyltransferase [Pseudomonadota bacterium]